MTRMRGGTAKAEEFKSLHHRLISQLINLDILEFSEDGMDE